jgi:chromosome segregation protein
MVDPAWRREQVPGHVAERPGCCECVAEYRAGTARCRQKLHPLRESIHAVRLKEQEARLIENQFDEQLKESSLSEEELAQILGKTRPSTLQAEIVRLDNEISSLGAVNLGALQELESAQARKGYLDSQLKDLQEASDTLKDAIRRMDVETRERLLETVQKLTPT